MPIYAYRCTACGHAKDVLQKVSDPVLTTCPACGAESFAKQVTAAGFQLKGSGWYVTDFRGGPGGGEKKPAEEGKDGKSATEAPAAKPAETPGAASTPTDKPGVAASPAPAPASTPTSASGG